MKKSLYELLEVGDNAAAQTIDAAYERIRERFAALEETDPTASESFKLVTIAYEVVSDPVARDMYDRRIARQKALEIQVVAPPSDAAQNAPKNEPVSAGPKTEPRNRGSSATLASPALWVGAVAFLMVFAAVILLLR